MTLKCKPVSKDYVMQSNSTQNAPKTDPTPIFDLFRNGYASDLLTAAVAHFNVFSLLAESPRSIDQLADAIGLAPRAANVLFTALRAMRLIELREDLSLYLTSIAREHLDPSAYFDISDYVGLAASSSNVLNLVERLRTNKPIGAESDDEDQSTNAGTAFIYKQGQPSAMDSAELARHFTLALCGRAKNVAPALAVKHPLSNIKTLLDIGGGTGIYSIAYLQRYPKLTAIVMDRPEVLKVAAEFAQQYGVADRLELSECDMFEDDLPNTDAILLSNILHDWDIPECKQLINRCAKVLPAGGELMIHDVFLNDDHDGPLEIALYSTALFTLTEGRAYSEAEYRSWLVDASLEPSPKVDTLVHCGVVAGRKKP
jgi:ubiquinone/menaquinone biosynthesis C-methylase UbiE/DNA-binding transcriptional ArsR family regulator